MLKKIICGILILTAVVGASLSLGLKAGYAMPNPLVNRSTIEEAEQHTGCMALTLPEDFTLANGEKLTLSKIITISDSTIDLRYESNKNGHKEVCLRAASKDKMDMENISGVYTKNWETILVRKNTVGYTTTDTGMQAAFWSDRGRYFSASADGLTKEEFISLLNQIVF